MTTVLYIEDNPLNIRLIRKHLKRIGIPMLEAMDGITGIDISIAEKPSVILLDINLPDIDGFEVARQLNAHPETADIPIIALTANAMHGDRELCLKAGCNGYIAKPIARQELYNALRNFVPEAFATPV